MDKSVAQNRRIATEERDRIWFGLFEMIRLKVEKLQRFGFETDEQESMVKNSWIFPYMNIAGFSGIVRKSIFKNRLEFITTFTLNEDPDQIISLLNDKISEHRLQIIDNFSLASQGGKVQWSVASSTKTTSSVATAPDYTGDNVDSDFLGERVSMREVSEEAHPSADSESVSHALLPRMPVEEMSLVDINKELFPNNDHRYNEHLPVGRVGQLVGKAAERVLDCIPTVCFSAVVYAPPHSGKTTIKNLHLELICDSDECLLWTSHRPILVTNMWKFLRLGIQKIAIIPSKEQFFHRLGKRKISFIESWYDDMVKGVEEQQADKILSDKYIPEILAISKHEPYPIRFI